MQILGLLVLCGAVILHATMWPYDFRFDWGSVPARLLSATDLPFEHGRLAEKKDIVLNVILFLPFGALLFLHRAKGIAASRSVLAPALLGMLFSVGIETTQCFLPTRTPSLVDVCTNTFGALLGAIAAWTSLRMVEQTTEEEARMAFHRNAPFIFLAAYSLVLVASNVYTLDPVRSLPELAVRGKAFLRSSWIGDATLAKAAGPILYLGVLTYLAAEWAMLSFPGFRSASTYFIIFLAGSAFSLCLETLQVFFRSRVPLRSDILFGAVGCGYGILLHRLTGFPVFHALGSCFKDTASVLKFRLPTLKPLFLLHYPLLILYAFLYPFDFSPSYFHFDVRALIPFLLPRQPREPRFPVRDPSAHGCMATGRNRHRIRKGDREAAFFVPVGRPPRRFVSTAHRSRPSVHRIPPPRYHQRPSRRIWRRRRNVSLSSGTLLPADRRIGINHQPIVAFAALTARNRLDVCPGSGGVLWIP